MKKDDSLSKAVRQVIRNKATEPPHSGTYNKNRNTGTYLCRGCGQALFPSTSKFEASCGWPSFDKALPNRVMEAADADGRRMEILCSNCHAHLGHVFDNEGFTAANRRFCVNSLSLDFVQEFELEQTEEAILAGGCFWGVAHLMKQLQGVLKTEVGYTGGHTLAPTYSEICSGTTGHVEALRVLYDPNKISYEQLLKYFFEIHDPTQQGGQGPDQGQQYESVVFYYNEEQKKIAEQLVQTLKQLGFDVVTRLLPVSVFWAAESKHQDYYDKTKQSPYCHRYIKRFP